MFESAEIGHKIKKERYSKEVPALREALLDAQYEVLQKRRFPVIIVISGVDGAGKGETVNLLNEWMDPRHIQTNSLRVPTDEESERPSMWRFWRALPAKGKTGIFSGSWYSQPLFRRVYGEIKLSEFDQMLDSIVRFENMLTDEGALLLKFWFHLSKDNQQKRLKELMSSAKTSWRVTETEWRHLKLHDKFVKVSERALRQTSTAEAPWIIVEGADERFRSLTVGNAILEAIKKRLAQTDGKAHELRAPPLLTSIDGVRIVDTLDLSKKLEKKDYDDALAKWQGRLNLLTREEKFKRISVVAAFEGCDAAGKGGAIRRVTSALDARQYDIIPIAAPTDEEKVRPYLWRFWRHIPARGRFTIFDRTWYGRVLVERVEGFCGEGDWMRAYSEINDFEEQLVAHGIVVAKFWLQISKDEQLRRFEERQATAFKRFKITEEDWRNREKWDLYSTAVSDMIDRTSTEIAPWTLVEANDKNYARIKILKTLCDRIESALDRV